jgi:hypothetical protein
VDKSARGAWEKALRAAGKGRSKYGNQRAARDGVRFDSLLEADRYSELKLLQMGGAVRYFLRQVPFEVAPGVKYRCDFLVFPVEGREVIEDCKGVLTSTSRTKIAVVQARYGIEVKLLTRKDVRRYGKI